MSLSHNDWVTIAWSTSIPIVVFFAALAMYLCWRSNKDTELTVDSFITARNSVGVVRVAWSFYAGALGSWVITGPANFASYAGIIGLSMYALASGIPIIVIAFFGKIVQDKVPNASSAADFVNWRFGPLAQLYVVILLMFNMSMALLSEYTTISSLFRDFIGTNDIPIILAISVLTLAYTIYGGLSISIITDQFQGFASVVFAVAISVYIGINFKAPLPTPLTSALWGTNEWGYSAILTMPVSLMAATVFSEAMWQRCWASSTPRALYTGASIATVGVIVVVFGFGFLGFLAVWGGLTNENTNPNLYLFQVPPC
jgi:solute:Na+ symporter, SSS family